jgi:hypothetical protein
MEITQIHQKIYEIRSQKIMLDFDLAELYEVETRVLNQAVKRNIDIFPPDFMFQLTPDEYEMMSSQFVMTSSYKRPKSSPPLAFTEHGVTMLSNVLKSKKARLTSIAIVRAFIALKENILTNTKIIEHIKTLELKYDKQFDDIFEVINYLLKKDSLEKQTKDRDKIGYKTDKSIR